MTDYGKRKCIQCGKVFMVTYPSQLTCADECRILRKKFRDIASRLRREKMPDNLDWANARLEELLENKKTRAENSPEKSTDDDDPDDGRDGWENPELYRHVCIKCGSTFRSLYKEDSYCSESCEKEALICHADL